MGGLGVINPSESADAEYSASIKISSPLVSKIEEQSHETPDEAEVQRLVYATRREKDHGLREELEEVKVTLPDKTQRAVDLACEKGASNWLTVIHLKDMDFDLNSGAHDSANEKCNATHLEVIMVHDFRFTLKATSDFLSILKSILLLINTFGSRILFLLMSF